MSTDRPLDVGDWVTITGRVKEFHPNMVDIGVEVFSKTDQYTAFVRRDLCAPTPKPLPKEPDDGSIALLDGMAYQRLTDHWYRPGRTERLTWAELNAAGDIEVIDVRPASAHDRHGPLLDEIARCLHCPPVEGVAAEHSSRLAADDFHDAVCTGPGVPTGFTCSHPSHARLAAEPQEQP